MRRRFCPPVLMVALLGSLLQPALAQDSVRLTRDECLRMALANNLDLVSAKKDPAIAEHEIDRAKAAFDGVIGSSASIDDFSSSGRIFNSLVIGPPDPSGQDRQTLAGNVSLSHNLSFGANYELKYDYSDFDRLSTEVDLSTGNLTGNDVQSTSNGLTFTYNMPLLGGLGTEVNTIDILLKSSGLETSRENLRLQATTTLQAAEDAYWDVLAAREGLRISRLALDRAEDLLSENRKKVEVGTLAPIEITKAEAGVASQIEALIVAETNLENAEDVLLQLLGVSEDDPMWEQSLEIADAPSYAPVEIDLDAAIAEAIDRRPEMTSSRQTLRDRELSERVARRGVRHKLDLRAVLTPGTKPETDARISINSTTVNDSRTTSTDDNWNVGLTYSFPLRNRAAKADYAVAKLNSEKSRLAVQKSERDIRVEVRQSVRNINSGTQRVAAARKNVELQQETLDAERKKYENGMSTSFEVLQIQKDLADAELAEINARLAYLKSLTAFERAKGTLLEARGLKLGP